MAIEKTAGGKIPLILITFLSNSPWANEDKMNLSQQSFMNAISNEQADLAMVESVAEAMRNKLCKKRNEGFGGWHKPSIITDQALKDMLIACVNKGDMVDVLNVAAMIYTRAELYGDET